MCALLETARDERLATLEPRTVLVLGGTGRTGSRVLEQLLARGVEVRAIVRSAEKLDPVVAASAKLRVVEADLLSMSDRELQDQVHGCVAVISCLGHNLNLQGIYGSPRDLVAKATSRLCSAIEAVKPPHPVRFILMSSVSVHRPGVADSRRGSTERAMMWGLRGLIPPARDHQMAADYLCENVGTSNEYVQWVVVRPDSLLEGSATDYSVHDGLVSSLAKPDSTHMADVAHFMCDLAVEEPAWGRWNGKLPVIVSPPTVA